MILCFFPLSRFLAAALASLALAVPASATGPDAAQPDPTVEHAEAFAEVSRLFDAERYARAAELLEELRETDPHDRAILYNLACARAMQGETAAAEELLLDALGVGFVDFFHLMRDEHLEPIRTGRVIRAVDERWAELLDTRAAVELGVYLERLDGPYVTRSLDDLRVHIISSHGEAETDAVAGELRRVASIAGPLFDPAAAPLADRPDPWVFVILPTPADFVRLTGLARPDVGGVYERDLKRLIARDLGPSLRHEFMHALHWRHCDRLGQRHPIWIQEGLASLVEDLEPAGDRAAAGGGGDGAVVGGGNGGGDGGGVVPSWRTNIASRLASNHRLTPWDRLMTMDRRSFVLRRPRAHYAEARAVMHFFHERGKLAEWYGAYVGTFDADPSGRAAVETVFRENIAGVQESCRVWLTSLDEVGEVHAHRRVGLGVVLSPGDGTGPRVDEIVSMNPRDVGGRPGLRLRNRDVINAVDGDRVRTLDDLYRLLGEHEPGDAVTVTVRRGSRTLAIECELVEEEW